MQVFDSREQGFEAAFARNEEATFRMRLASLKRLGGWAADALKRDDSDAYAHSLVARALMGADDETLIADLAHDLKDAGVSAHRVRSRLGVFALEAAREFQG